MKALQKMVEGNKNVGIDVESINSINIENEEFINRNFTPAEQEYCSASPSPQSSFCGTWSAKEAVFKSLHVESKGGGAAMKDIEIVREKGVPTVKLHGSAEAAAKAKGVKSINISISHDDYQSVAVCLLLI